MFDSYMTISAQQYSTITKKYEEFQRTCGEEMEEPVNVYSPLPQKNLDELYLIREISKTLQKKKEEDMKKQAAQAAAAAAAAEESKPEGEKTEEGKTEEGKTEEGKTEEVKTEEEKTEEEKIEKEESK